MLEFIFVGVIESCGHIIFKEVFGLKDCFALLIMISFCNQLIDQGHKVGEKLFMDFAPGLESDG